MARKSFRIATTLALLAALAVPVAGRAVTEPAGGTAPVDVRDAAAALAPTPIQVDAMRSLVARFHDVKIRWNAPFGTPRSIVRWGSTLTDARPGVAADVARGWLRANAGLFGWRAADVDALREVTTLRQPDGGPLVVLFHQRFGPLEGNALGGSLSVSLDAANRILTVRANVVRSPRLAADRATLSASDAFARVSGTPGVAVTGRRGEWSVLDRAGFAFNHFARRVAFPSGQGPARPAWEVTWVKGLAEGYRVIVDAATGRILWRRDAVKFDAPEGRVFRNYPGSRAGGTHEMMSFAGDPKASPQGWFAPGAPLTTIGNNATTATNWGVFIAPDGPGGVRPLSPDGVFDYPFTDAWSASQCGRNPISDATRTADTPAYAQDALPAVVSLFYHHNVMHDFFYRMGFDDKAGAMQVNNNNDSDVTKENDPLFGLVQAGALAGDVPGAELGRDNAYMFPNPDGIPSWSGMFLFESIPGAINAPCVDGDFDAAVIYHEYTHAVSNRWVGAEFGNLDTHQGGSMGESWGDFYGLHYLYRNGLQTRDALGPYVTGNGIRGIRNFPLSRVPVRFGDIGYDLAGEEVHSDGEIWNGVLWDLRTTLARANGRNPNAGADLAAQLVADAMPLSGPSPDMLDMRDAILAADRARTKGANQSLLWSVFARRGMGASAFSKDANDINPRPAFDSPVAAQNGRIVARIVDDATGAPVAGARVIIGEYEARVSPVTRSGAGGGFTFLVQQGRYPVTILAKGYGSRTLDLRVRPGVIDRLEIRMSLNYASAAAGAEVVESSNLSSLGAPSLALDDNETSVWLSDPDTDGTEESFIVDLAGSEPVDIDSVRISALPLPGTGRFSALRDWTLYASLDGSQFDPVARGQFTADYFRPVAPNLRYKTWTLDKPVKASFIKIVGRPQGPTATRLEIAELQVFGRGEAVAVASAADGGKAKSYHDEGVALVATADANITYQLMQEACVFPPPTQGLDAWVSQVPDEYADGTYVMTAAPETVSPVDPRVDLDVFFLSRNCLPSGDAASGAATETGTLTQGTRYIVSHLYTTTSVNITVDVEAT